MERTSDENETYGAGAVPPEYQTHEVEEEYKSTFQVFVETILTDRLALFGAIICLLFIFVAIFAPFLAPYEHGSVFDTRVEPNGVSEQLNDDGEVVETRHILGTDAFGHDLLTRIMFGARISLFVAAATVIFAFSVGTLIGVAAGYYGGWVDSILMRYVDFQWAFPSLILAVGIIAYVGGIGVWNVILAIGVAYIDDFARITRGEVLRIREQEYIMAAKAIGMSDRRIMIKEMLPNSVAPLIVQMTVMIPLTIIAEAGLSFLGLGVSPDNATWGLILADGRQFISSAWWISVFPGLAIMFAVLGFNMLGDGLRDSFDVKDVDEETTR